MNHRPHTAHWRRSCFTRRRMLCGLRDRGLLAMQISVTKLIAKKPYLYYTYP